MVSLGTTEPAKDVLRLETLMATIDGAIVSGEMPEALPSHCVTSVMTQAPSSSVAFPFRIEDNLLLEDGLLQKKNMIVQAAMVWNNLGIACICQSHVDRRNRRTLRRASLHYLKMSFTALERNYGERIISEDAMTLAGLRTRSMPCLLIAVLNTLLHAYLISKQVEKARKPYDTLVELRAVAHTMDDSHSTVVSHDHVQGAPAA
jgi:hypothetical protein